jgi:uncharacterized protein YbcI
VEADRGNNGGRNGGVEREISRGIVALYKEYMGRGPTSARTFINRDVVTCVVGDALTKAERQLAESDRGHVVREIRRQFQEAMSEDVKRLAAEVTGREVICMLSDHDPIRDIAVEVWVLEPED